MEAWRKGREFASMLERKRMILQGNIVKSESRLAKIKLKITEHQQECADINQQIKMLTPSGLHCQADIHAGIRQQGALLAYQQLVFHKINQLESEKHHLEHSLEQYHAARNLLDKKNYKLSYYLQPIRQEHIRRYDNNVENEIQDITVYGRKND